MLVLGRGAGSIGPWRANIDGLTDGCVGWDKSDTDADDWLTNMGRACRKVRVSIVSSYYSCVQYEV